MRVLHGTVATIVVCLALAGCQEDGEEPGTGSSASGTSSPSEDTTASGPAIEGDIFTVHAPDGWTKSKEFSTGFLDQYAEPGGAGRMAVAEIAGEVRPLDEVAKDNFSVFATDGIKRKRVADATVAGEPAYHFTADAGFGEFDESFGVVKDGNQVTITITTEGSPEERQAVIDSILGSWEWK
ncbi:MAG: hypothetical protein ABWX84_01665 [Nocardioides sp.]